MAAIIAGRPGGPMLALAIILTIVTGLLFAIGFAAGGYVLYVKFREYRQSSGGNSETAESRTRP